MALAAGWPVYEVFVSQGWQEPGAAVSVLIARRSPVSGKVAAAMLLVDLACLGVKSAQVKLFKDVGEYNAGMRAHAFHIQPMAPASFNLAAKIVRTGLEYAADLGFRPDPVFAQAQPLLSGADPGAEPTPVPAGGEDGKPLYISGPYDDVQRIVDQLTRRLGEDNFHFILQGPSDMLL
jgi:hypothetical protein